MTDQIVENIYYRPYPKNIKDEDKQLFNHLLERKIVIAIKNRIVKNAYVNNEGHIWSGLKLYKDVSFHLRKNSVKNYYIELKHILKNRFYKDVLEIDKACWIIDGWSYNYGHFLIDFLQRYIQLQLKYKSEFCVLLPESYVQYDYLFEILNTLKIKYHFIKENEIVKLKQLYIADYYRPAGIINNEIIEHLRSRFFNLVKTNKVLTNRKRIYIARKRAGKRKIINEDEILQILEKYDFDILYMEDISIINKIEIFYTAEIIVGIHGAGLANMLFMKKGIIIELRPRASIDQWAFFELASALEHNYYYQLCDFIPDPLMPNNADIIIDAKEFEMLLASILKN